MRAIAFTDRALAMLKIRPDEVRMVGLIALLFGVIDLGRHIGESSADALFFLRYGVEYLPTLYIVLGIATFAASLGYSACLRRLDKWRFFVLLLAFMALLLLVERAVILLGLPVLYPALWLSVNIISTLLYTLTWTAADDVCDTRQAKRLFPIFVSAGILGALLSSLIIGPVARLLGTENLILVYAVLLVIGLFLLRIIARGYFQVAGQARKPATLLADMRVGFDYVSRSALLQKVAIVTVLLSALYFAVSYPFGLAVAKSYSNEADLAGFIGLFEGLSTALVFAVALLIANRLYARIGIVNALLIQPITYVFGFALFALNFGLGSAIAVRLSQMVAGNAIGDGAYGAFFHVVPSERRAEVRAFDSGVPEQIGAILSGVMLILVQQVLSQTAMFVMGMVVAMLCAWVVWRMRPSYIDALVAALQAGRAEVFTAGDRIFAGFRSDADAVRIVTAALDEPKPVIQQLAAELLAQMDAVSAVPALIGRLGSMNVEVRTTCVRVLGQLGARQAARPVMALLRDPAPVVRSAALAALPSLYDSRDPELASAINASLVDPELAVRVQAAISLARNELGQSLATLTGFLHDATGEDAVLCVLQALEAVLQTAATHPDQPADAAVDAVDALERCLQDESPAVRSAACRALTWAPNLAALAVLADRLSDAAPSVRAAAAQSLCQIGPATLPVVLPRLSTAHDPAHVLDALPPGDPAAYATLCCYAEAEAGRLRQWREAYRAIPDAGPVTRFLLSTLGANATQSEQNLIKAIGLIGHQAVIQQVAKAMQTTDMHARSAAIEALDMLGDRQLVKVIVPLLEELAPNQVADSDRAVQAVRRLAADQDEWLRTLAGQAAGEMGLSHGAEQSTHNDVATPGVGTLRVGGSMETLPTLLLLKRTLLLKEVDLFSTLAPNDLVQIAQIAQERWLPDETVLCREGEAAEELFLITEGHVRVSRVLDGQEQFLAIRRAGEVIGEMAIVESIPRTATVRALGDTRALVISSAMFREILRERPEVSLAVMRVLSRRLRETEELSVRLNQRP